MPTGGTRLHSHSAQCLQFSLIASFKSWQFKQAEKKKKKRIRSRGIKRQRGSDKCLKYRALSRHIKEDGICNSSTTQTCFSTSQFYVLEKKKNTKRPPPLHPTPLQSPHLPAPRWECLTCLLLQLGPRSFISILRFNSYRMHSCSGCDVPPHPPQVCNPEKKNPTTTKDETFFFISEGFAGAVLA